MGFPTTTKRASAWWPLNVEHWVNDRGATVLVFNVQFTASPGDWEALHQRVEALRAAGRDVWVIRAPAPQLIPDTLDITFDQKWKHHLLAFALPDEGEDKDYEDGTRLDYWANLAKIIPYLVAQVQVIKAYMPDMPIFFNGNGTHVTDPASDGGRSQSLYLALAAAGVTLFCQDNYMYGDNQIVSVASGMWGYPISVTWNGSDLIRKWTGCPTWVTIESGNQQDHKAGDPAWGEPSVNPAAVFVGSRALSVQDVATISVNAPDGIMWFPQAQQGAVNDATAPELESTIATIDAGYSSTPGIIPPAPIPTPTPPSTTPTVPSSGGPPNGPYGLLVNGIVGGVRITFVDNADAESDFVIERGTSQTDGFVQIARLPASPGVGQIVSYTDTTAVAGVSYYYRVYAQGNGYDSGIATSGVVFSMSAPVTTPPPVTPPAVPTVTPTPTVPPMTPKTPTTTPVVPAPTPVVPPSTTPAPVKAMVSMAMDFKHNRVVVTFVDGSIRIFR